MRIAILAPTAGPAFRSDARGGVGGAERQLAALGCALAGRGHTLDVMIAGDGGEPVATPGGRLWPRYPLGGLPLFKLIHPKGTALRRFLRERGSEVLLQRGAAELTGLAAGACRRRGIPFVFSLASDTDLEPGREIVPHPQDRLLYRRGLRRADALVAQTEEQARRLRVDFNRGAEVIPSFLDGPLPVHPAASGGEAVLWGGNLRPVKRPEWLLELAGCHPEVSFLVYGGPAAGHEAYATRVAARLRERPNVEYLGYRPPSELPGLFRRARVLLNTSEREGFPNTFLEAWRHGVPVLATVDPDGLLSSRGLGATARDLAGLAAAMAALMAETPAERLARADRALSFLRERHDPEGLADRWESLLAGLARGPV